MLAEAGMVREAGRSTTMGNTTYLLRPERRVGQNGYEDGLVIRHSIIVRRRIGLRPEIFARFPSADLNFIA